MSIDVKVIKAKDLSLEMCDLWTDIRAQNPALYSPYFHVEYTKRVGQLRDDAFVAVIYRHNDMIGFFPYQGPQPGKSGFARPIGAPLTDYHGMIIPKGCDIGPIAVLQEAGIGAYHYSAFVDPDNALSSHHSTTDAGAVMDISMGAQAWRDAHNKSYRRHLKSHNRRARRSCEEYGDREAVFQCTDSAVFEQLMMWKKQKFHETGKYDVLSVDWTRDLIFDLWNQPGELRCDMHALYFGNTLAAIDLGLTDGTTFHSWIVGYDDAMQSYAPGIQLLEALIDEAQDLGYQTIDLGVEIDGYKRHYSTLPVSASSGFVAIKGPAAALSALYGVTEKIGRNALGDAPGKFRRRYSQIAACDDSFSGRAKAMIDAVKSAQK